MENLDEMLTYALALLNQVFLVQKQAYFKGMKMQRVQLIVKYIRSFTINMILESWPPLYVKYRIATVYESYI